jgi:uncharacterized protein
MTRIGVLSDTHAKLGGWKLPDAVARGFEGVDLILHAGDLTNIDILDTLELIAPVKAVRGNCDFESAPDIPSRRIVEVAECRIALIHNMGPSEARYAAEAVSAFGDSVDCVVFGHSHKPYNEVRNGILLFNPGSPTQRRHETMHSFGILTVDGKNIDGEIIRF